MSQGGGGAAAAAGGGAGAAGGGNANQAAGAAIRQVIKGNSKAPRLEGSFEVYRVEVQMYLEDREAWDVVTGAEVRHANDADLQADFDRKDRLARSTILRGLRGCQDDEAEKICTMATSKDMWDTIVADKTQRDFSYVSLLKGQLYATKHSKGFDSNCGAWEHSTRLVIKRC
eukprot:jgi/Phyca11/20873/fgenesh1_pg.PHYCAscaffold_75_\